jgi:hypothetical protein
MIGRKFSSTHVLLTGLLLAAGPAAAHEVFEASLLPCTLELCESESSVSLREGEVEVRADGGVRIDIEHGPASTELCVWFESGGSGTEVGVVSTDELGNVEDEAGTLEGVFKTGVFYLRDTSCDGEGLLVTAFYASGEGAEDDSDDDDDGIPDYRDDDDNGDGILDEDDNDGDGIANDDDADDDNDGVDDVDDVDDDNDGILDEYDADPDDANIFDDDTQEELRQSYSAERRALRDEFRAETREMREEYKALNQELREDYQDRRDDF